LIRLYYQSPHEAGTDEAGRGCLAGPVTAAAVILPEKFELPGLTDSKQLSAADRTFFRPIIEDLAISYGVYHVFPEIIDRVNILNAAISAMHGALRQLAEQPAYIAVDGNRFKPFGEIPHTCIVQGDAKYLNIAAASVLAKTHRDAYMEKQQAEYPMYNWKQNKGYPTLAHREAIRKHGSCPYHRRSFRLLPEQLKIDF
jgi:ribonuclease HII